MTHYRSGLLQLRHADWTAGILHLRRAMELDPGAIRPVLASLQTFEQDLAVEEPAIEEPALDHYIVVELAALRRQYAAVAQSLDAREAVGTDDALLPHALDVAAMRALTAALAQSERVSQAWVARKCFEMVEETPHYAILVTWQGSVASELAGLKRLTGALEMPGSFTVFTDTHDKEQARRVRQSCREPVYRKGR